VAYITSGFGYSLMNQSDFSHTSAIEHPCPTYRSNGNLLEMVRMTQPVIGWAV